MKNILITGSTGFLGTHLVNFLKKKNVKLKLLNSKNCDLRNFKNLQKLKKIKYDIIIHLAAWTQAGDFCLKFPGKQWLINQEINTNVLKYWYLYQKQAKMIAMGTSCSYSSKLSLNEKNYMKDEPIESLYTYAMTKRMLLQGLRALNKQFKMKYLYLIPSTLYGPNYHLDGRQMHFIFDLIRKIFEGKFHKKKVILWGNGNQRRELIHVKDFIKIMWNINNKYSNEIFNIGGGKEYSIKFFAKKISKILKFDESKIIYDTSKYVGAKSKNLDISKLKQFKIKTNQITLENGIKEVINWYKRLN